MGHAIGLIDPQGHLDKETLQDFIDLFFDAKDSVFGIEVVPTNGKAPNKSIRGMCAHNGRDAFKITLYAGNIKEHMSRGVSLGGNVTQAQNLKHGLYLVLTHELRHAYQAIYFGENSTLHKGRYKARAGEIDARRHVDENYENVAAFLGLTVEPVGTLDTQSDVDILIDVISESSDGTTVRTDDVWDQVMTLPGDPESTFRRVEAGLLARGIRLG